MNKIINLVAALVVLSLRALAIEPADLYGTWRLVSNISTLVATGEHSDLYGPAPLGLLTYTPDGRMSAILCDSSRPKPSDLAKVTDEERLKLYRTMNAYAGTFTLAGSTVTHHIEISLNGTWTGTDQVRHLTLDGDTLIIRTDPQPRNTDGRVAVNELKWVRVQCVREAGGK